MVVNGGQLGYFRTLYTAAMLADLAKALPALAPIDQLGLLRDQFALAGGATSPRAALDLLAAVPRTPIRSSPAKRCRLMRRCSTC